MRYLSILTAVVAFGLWNGLRAQPLSGSYTINGTSNFSTNTFATIQEAFDSLNQRGASGPVIFTVEVDGTAPDWDPTNEPNTITLAGYACTNCRVTLQFNLSAQVVLAKSPATTQNNRFVIRLGGHTQSTLTSVQNAGQITNLTIIGSNNLIIRSTANGGTSTGVIGVVSTSSAPLNVSGLTLRNINIEGNGRPRTFSGIYVGGDASLPSAATGTLEGLSIISNSIDSVSRPIHIAGVRANFGTQNRPILVDSNSIGLASNISWASANNIGAIHILGSKYVRVRFNTVTGAESGTNYQFSGVRLDSCEDFTINANHIYGLKYTGSNGWGMYGIAVNMPGTFLLPNPVNVIANNMIADIVGDGYTNTFSGGIYSVSGIFVQASSANNNLQLTIAHNSISLFGNNTSNNNGGGGSAGICIGSNAQGGLTILNNIFQNNLNPSSGNSKSAYGIWIIPSSLSNTTINYNAYRVNAPLTTPANNIIARVGSNDYTSLSAFNSATGYEANGLELTSNVPFVSPTNLHVDPNVSTLIINAGSTVSNGTQDFDGDVRPLGGGPGGDPGTAPDIGADEVDGTLIVCPTAIVAPEIQVTTPPNAGTSYLWGTAVQVDLTSSSPAPQGIQTIIYSLDGGATWTAGPSVGSFPATFSLPPLTPPNYTGTILIAVAASNFSTCPPASPNADTSNNPVSLNLTDRPGNRLANAIPVSLTYNSTTQRWEATISDDVTSPGLSNEYGSGTGSSNPRGTGAREIFFLLTLPACMDSLQLSLCGGAGFDTYLSMINLSLADTIANDDGGCSLQSAFTAIAGLGSSPITPASALLNYVRDTMRLAQGDQVVIIVEAFSATSSNQGPFTLQVQGWEAQAPNASITVGSITYSSGQTHNINATGSSVSEIFTATSTVSGNSYQWELYNPGNTTTTPDATGSGGTFNHTFNASGLYTLILLSTNGACGPERDTLFVNVSLTTALSVGSGSFAAFPNPSTGSFTVVAPAAGSYDLRILDVAGKLVYADRMEGERKDLRLTLPAGTYQLLLSGEGKSGLIRLIITE